MQIATDGAIVLQYRDAFFAVIIVLIGLAISALFGFRLVKSVTQPITDMVQAVHRIRRGDSIPGSAASSPASWTC